MCNGNMNFFVLVTASPSPCILQNSENPSAKNIYLRLLFYPFKPSLYIWYVVVAVCLFRFSFIQFLLYSLFHVYPFFLLYIFCTFCILTDKNCEQKKLLNVYDFCIDIVVFTFAGCLCHCNIHTHIHIHSLKQITIQPT